MRILFKKYWLIDKIPNLKRTTQKFIRPPQGFPLSLE